jgi:hypothetical protein
LAPVPGEAFLSRTPCSGITQGRFAPDPPTRGTGFGSPGPLRPGELVYSHCGWRMLPLCQMLWAITCPVTCGAARTERSSRHNWDRISCFRVAVFGRRHIRAGRFQGVGRQGRCGRRVQRRQRHRLAQPAARRSAARNDPLQVKERHLPSLCNALSCAGLYVSESGFLLATMDD